MEITLRFWSIFMGVKMNDIHVPSYTKIELLNENEFGLRKKKLRKVSLPEYPNRYMRAMNRQWVST